MGDPSTTNHRICKRLNPWVLSLQKMGLELKCPLCLSLLNQPFLLPCNHIFCNSCIPRSSEFGSACPVCKAQFADQDLRPAPFMENMVAIYRSMDSMFCENMFQPVSSDARKILEQCPISTDTKFDEKLCKEPIQTIREGDSSSGRSVCSLTANKHVHVSLKHSVNGSNVEFDKCSVPRDGKSEELGMSGSVEIEFNKRNSNYPPTTSQLRPGGLYGCGTVEIDMNQVAQLSPDSPPSFSDSKGSDNDSSRRSDHSPERYLDERSVKKITENKTILEKRGISASRTEDHLNDFKRQRKLSHGQLEMGVKSSDHNQSALPSEDLVTFNSKVELESGVPISGGQPPTITDNSDTNKTICAFCQSSKISEVTGLMLHYASGKLVGDEATHSNVIHVHVKCIEWAPQVYYVGETVKNLEKEVARGAKLKCSRCGQKGAALGCCLKSCRKSYHFPCAVGLSDCRWDCENFLVLCPAHSSHRFPNEKSKSGKNISKVHPLMTPQQSNLWESSPKVFCGSALSTEEKFLLVRFARICGATVSRNWNPNVTHVIAATDVNGACTRTIKVLMAILNGRWILKIDWIKACMEAKNNVDEEPYEVSLDSHGCCDGPKTGRLRALDNETKLFSGLRFYFIGDFVPGYKEDLQKLVEVAGGTVLESHEKLVAQGCEDQPTPSMTLLVYNLDPPQGSKLGEEVSILWERLNEAQNLASAIGSSVIGHTWLLESIAACKLQPLVS